MSEKILETSKQLEMIMRLDIILSVLKDKINPPANMDEFLERLKKRGIGDISRRTIFRHFDYLKFHFGIYVQYDHSSRQYRILDQLDEVPDEASFQRLLNMVSLVGRMDKLLSSSSQLQHFIKYEHESSLQHVMGHMETCLEAASRKKVIRFDYQSFRKEESKSYSLEPFVVAEKSNRWYVIGYDLEANIIKTFGLDRILSEQIQLLRKKATHHAGFDYDEYFSKVIGIEYKAGEVEEIVFETNKKQAKYIESLPLHESQERKEETEESVLFSIAVVPTYELEMKFLSYGETVKILAPKSFRKTIKQRLKKAYKAY